MSAATETPPEHDEKAEGRPLPKIKAPQIVMAVGIGFAIITVASGISGGFFAFHDESDKSREVFYNVPTALEVAFYTVIPVMVVYGAVLFAARAKNWQRGAPDNRATTPKNVKRRLKDFRAGVFMKTLLRDPAAGIMHSLIYFSFLVLLAVTTVLEIDHQMPESLKFLHGTVYQAYIFVADTAGVLFLVGIGWALFRRYVQRPYRIRIKSKPEHLVILGVFGIIGVTGFLAEMFRLAEQGRPQFEEWAWVGYPLAGLVDGWDNLAGWHQGMWIAHVISFVAFLVILPTTMLRHMFTSPLNMYLRDKDRPKGAMKPMPNLMETELESFGASTIEDFTWKQLLDTDSCTMCGRCTSVCPAHATGKPLDPREIVLKTGEVMAATGDPVVSPPIGLDADITIGADSIFERISAEEVWACTTCKACDEICPVNIEILDKILDMRRYLSLMESNFPTELGGAYRSMENSSNPWGLSQNERADWANDLDGIDIVDGSEPFTHEYLYWVGCAGSFDDKNRKVTRAMAKLMQRAGLDFAILGPSELCTGDPARRSGNEYIFQMLAMQNIETLDGMGVKKIVTQCPHCFNTLGNEYPQLGGDYEVVHHSQLLEELVADGTLDLSEAKLEERVVYHDSCYLGRHNDVYLAPRNVIGSLGGIQVVEAERNGTKGMCCGAGGARMWMEESIGKQVNVERSQELLATGASRIATACPFCYIMIDDGVKGEGVEESEVKVGDIAMHVLDALEAGEAATAPTPATVGGGEAPAEASADDAAGGDDA
jgi:Fe-S oxidoreductase/nitrate reductase gamma subunit